MHMDIGVGYQFKVSLAALTHNQIKDNMIQKYGS